MSIHWRIIKQYYWSKTSLLHQTVVARSFCDVDHTANAIVTVYAIKLTSHCAKRQFRSAMMSSTKPATANGVATSNGTVALMTEVVLICGTNCILCVLLCVTLVDQQSNNVGCMCGIDWDSVATIRGVTPKATSGFRSFSTV